MALVGNISIKAGMDTAEFDSKIDKTKKKTGNFFKDLAADFGKKSIMGQSLKLMAGGGAIGALSMAAKEFNELTKKAEEFALAMDKGPQAAREATAELLKSIPIVGTLGEGFARIWGMMSGETAYVAKMNEATERTNALTNILKESMKEANDRAKSTADYMADIEERIARLGLSGTNLKLFDLNRDADKDIKKITEEATKGNKVIEDAKKEREKTLLSMQGDATKGIAPMQKTEDTGYFLDTGLEQQWVATGTKETQKYIDAKQELAKWDRIIANEQDKLNADANTKIEERNKLRQEELDTTKLQAQWEDYFKPIDLNDQPVGDQGWLDNINKYVDGVEKARKKEGELWDEAKKANEEALDPMDKYLDKISHLQELLDNGLSKDAYEKMKKNAMGGLKEDLSKQYGGGELKVIERKFSFQMPKQTTTPPWVLKQIEEAQRQTKAVEDLNSKVKPDTQLAVVGMSA